MLDLWIRSATVVDGTGASSFGASVGVRDGRVVAIDRRTVADDEPHAAVTLDADGLVLAPGFVDVHNHSDMAPLVDPSMPSTVRQGVTTVVVGNCGMSPFPASAAHELASWVVGEEATPAGPSLASLDSFGEFPSVRAVARLSR